jgi:hypothetical protein
MEILTNIIIINNINDRLRATAGLWVGILGRQHKILDNNATCNTNVNIIEITTNAEMLRVR